MSSLAPLLRSPHFTYSRTTTGAGETDNSQMVMSSYNEVCIADRVVRACAWSDSSADFVFGDGTVLSFCDEMQTFVAITASMTSSSSYSSSASNANNKTDSSLGRGVANGNGNGNEGDYFFTSLTLSKYENKVKEALQIYNYYSPRPRIIAGLTITPCEVWRLHSPIDSLVIAADRRLFERHGSRATLWCALRRISLTLHDGRTTFSVRWPAKAVERNGARSIFVRPLDENGCVCGTVESLRSFHYVWVEQTFPVEDPPMEWIEMLQIALQLDVEEVNHTSHTQQEKQEKQEKEKEKEDSINVKKGIEENGDGYTMMLYRTTPRTAQDRHPCRFSKLRRDHVHALIATTQMQHATCNREIRNPWERVLWRYDADPVGRIPHAVYWGLNARDTNNDSINNININNNINIININNNNNNNSGNIGSIPMCGIRHFASGAVLAMVREDESAVLAEPQGQSYVIHHWRRDGTHSQYHQSSNGELALPPVIPTRHKSRNISSQENMRDGNTIRNTLDDTSIFIEGGECNDGMVNSKISSSSLYFSGILEEAPLSSLNRGRYLPEVGKSCIQISQLNLASFRAQRQRDLGEMSSINTSNQLNSIPKFNNNNNNSSSNNNNNNILNSPNGETEGTSAEAILDRTRMRILSNDPALSAAAAEGNVVYLTSFIDGIGNFTALTNGTIRCHFDDRTILFLVPGADDSEENIVATCLFRDATQCSMRIVKCLPHHPMFRYITHALQFRRFARLSPESRNKVVEENDTTMKLMLISSEEKNWRRENEVEREVQELVTRTQELLSGNEELRRANRSLLHDDENGDVGGSSSAYFS